MSDLLKLKRVTLDVECLRDVKPPFKFSESQFLGNAVCCTLTGDGEYKDWIGDEAVSSMLMYLRQFDLVISFNGISFDYPLLGGSLFYPEHPLAKKAFENALKGKTVDLIKDFHTALGKRVGLSAVAIPTLGDAKEMEGGFAPQHWRNNRCFEVIEYCRGDVRRTDALFVKAASGEDLSVKTKEGSIRQFKCSPLVR